MQYTPVRQQRPLVITIIATIILLFTSLMFFLSSGGILILAYLIFTGKRTGFSQNDLLILFGFFINILGFIVAIGLLQLKKWAYWATIIYVALALYTAINGLIA